MLTKAIVPAVKDVTWQSTKESGVLSLHLEIICHFPSAGRTQAKLGRCYGKHVGGVTGSWGRLSAKLPSGNAKFDRLANHPQTPGLLVGLTSNLNIERGKSEESKKESREEIHK